MVVKVRKLTDDEIKKIKWVPINDINDEECPLCQIEKKLGTDFGRWANGE